VGLKTDGTVVAVGANSSGQCNVGGWTDITQVATTRYCTVGLKADGTVVAVGANSSGQCDVAGWTDIVQVATGWAHTVGLKTDNTVAAVGDNSSGQCDVGGWTDIVQVTAGGYHTVGLKADGTVVTAGPEIEFAIWNLVLAVPSFQCVLTISSTAGGSVTIPGEKSFTYDAGMVVDLVAEPEKGYRFVNWSGDVDTIARVSASTTTIAMHGYYSITANFKEIPPVNWPLVGGTIAAVVAVGLSIFFLRRKRAAQTM
jgi:alpha-tubulin suppressor-like RCC1 family protein